MEPVVNGLTHVIKFYTSWTCPFAQRVWITLNHLNVDYDLVESFTFDMENKKRTKDPNLLKINPNGVVPTLDVNGEIIVESIDIIQYLHKYTGNDAVNSDFVTESLMKEAESLTGKIGPKFYEIFYNNEEMEQDKAWENLKIALESFTDDIQENGYYKSTVMNVVDISLFPFIHRLYLVEQLRGKSLDRGLPWVQKLTDWLDLMAGNNNVGVTIPDAGKLSELLQNTL